MVSAPVRLAHGFATNFITMNLRPSKFDGLLPVPIIDQASGSGTVDIHMEFSIFESTPTGTLNLLHNRNFHKEPTSVEGGAFQPSNRDPIPDPDPLGSSRIPLANGRIRIIVLTMSAIVNLSGTPFCERGSGKTERSSVIQ